MNTCLEQFFLIFKRGFITHILHKLVHVGPLSSRAGPPAHRCRWWMGDFDGQPPPSPSMSKFFKTTRRDDRFRSGFFLFLSDAHSRNPCLLVYTGKMERGAESTPHSVAQYLLTESTGKKPPTARTKFDEAPLSDRDVLASTRIIAVRALGPRPSVCLSACLCLSACVS